MGLFGINLRFHKVSRRLGQVVHVLLTRPPLSYTSSLPRGKPLGFEQRVASLDLHVLGTPPAFILSHDQTLRLRFFMVSSRKTSQPCGCDARTRLRLYSRVSWLADVKKLLLFRFLMATPSQTKDIISLQNEMNFWVLNWLIQILQYQRTADLIKRD